jgi:hypothetical protein
MTATAAMPVAAHDFECRTCGARLAFPPHERTTHCVYCDSPAVIERPPQPDRPNPVFALGFVLPREAALEAARKWQRRIGVLRDPGPKRAPLDSLRAVYLPAYLYGAVARSSFNVRIGEYYYTTVNKRRVRRTQYYPLFGQHAAYVRDVVVTASRGIPNDELAHIEPFDLRALHRYTPALISGWPAEEATLSRADCLNQARAEAVAAVESELGRFLPGDTYESLTHRTELEHECLELALVPIWVFALRYDERKPPIRLLINAQTGRAYGKLPWSVLRVSLAVSAAVVVLIAIFFYAAYQGFVG